MGVYIIAPCFLENICEKKYITEVLLPFTQENNLTVGVDTSNVILDIYEQIAKNKPAIAYWIGLMSIKPSAFKKITKIDKKVNKKIIEYFLFICSSIVNQQKMIIFDYQNWKDFDFINPNKINYNGSNIILYDKDEAIEEIKPAKININESFIASGKSTIKNIKK